MFSVPMGLARDLQCLVAMGAVHTFHLDNGPAFISKASVNLQFSNPFKSSTNGVVER